ncbi:MAG: flagellar protein FlaG [Marinagarivorans sp.]|nr:flagellar protein FlaG [Marinagarivorans sp.]
MNDINSIKAPFLAPIAPKIAPVVAANKATVSGQSLPQDNVSSVSKADEVDNIVPIEAAGGETTTPSAAEELNEAITVMNDFVQSVQRDLHFHVDEESQKTVVKVVDVSSGDIIRQIPEETFLELARKMKEQGEMHFISAKG